MRGSTSMPAAVEMTIKVTSEKRSSYVEFESNKARDIAATRFAAEIHFEPQGDEPEKIWLTAETPSAAHSGEAISKAGRYVLDYLGEHGECGRMELTNNAEKFSEAAVKKALYNLVDNGLVKRVNEGGRGIAALYGLTEAGEENI